MVLKYTLPIARMKHHSHIVQHESSYTGIIDSRSSDPSTYSVKTAAKHSAWEQVSHYCSRHVKSLVVQCHFRDLLAEEEKRLPIEKRHIQSAS